MLILTNMLMPTNIVSDVEAVLLRNRPNYMTAYQILEDLPTPVRDQLILERGLPGQGSGNNYASATVVSDAAQMLPGIQIEFLQTQHVIFEVAGHQIRSSSPSCGLYRLP
jgi:hypothetical protein